MSFTRINLKKEVRTIDSGESGLRKKFLETGDSEMVLQDWKARTEEISQGKLGCRALHKIF